MILAWFLCFVPVTYLTEMQNQPGVGYQYWLVIYLLQIPKPLFLAVYLVFFGKLVYKVVDHFSSSQAEERLQADGYCEIILRFIGVMFLWGTIALLVRSFFIKVQNYIMTYFNYPENSKIGLWKMMFDFDLLGILITFLYVAAGIAVAFYLLRHGRFFIGLLSRRWGDEMEASEDAETQEDS